MHQSNITEGLEQNDLKRLCDVNPYTNTINKLEIMSDSRLWDLCIENTKKFEFTFICLNYNDNYFYYDR